LHFARKKQVQETYAGALIPLAVPCLIPSFFMEWAIPTEDADEFEIAEAAPTNIYLPHPKSNSHTRSIWAPLKLCLALSNTLQTLLTVFIF